MFIVPMNRLERMSGMRTGEGEAAPQQQNLSGGSFAQMFNESLKTLEQAQQVADEDALDLALGANGADLHTIMINAAVLESAVKTTVQLTSRAVTSYKESMSMQVCSYSKMERAMTPLVELMNKTDKVRIVGKGTDITFSIKGIGGVKCAGRRNIPDGEVYTAPVKDSVNGVISYNVPSVCNGIRFDNIRLEFKDGKIVKATSDKTDAINKIFDTDDGARYVGEFAMGVNPFITKAMGDILFDEKISGSIHFTPGACYDDAFNGNNSAIHWDLVLVQTKEMGGGEIYFDDKLIRKDGIFTLDELKVLNPENLK